MGIRRSKEYSDWAAKWNMDVKADYYALDITMWQLIEYGERAFLLSYGHYGNRLQAGIL